MTRVDDTPVHKAVREALANALIHANYYDRLGLVIHRRPKSISIANPGNLRISIEDALGGGLSDPRNFTLFKLFNMLNVMLNVGERAGSGIPNIYHVWQGQGWKTPVLEEKQSPDRTVLTLVLSPQEGKKVAIKSGDNKKAAISDMKKQAILDYLGINGDSRASELSELLSVNISRTKVYLRELVDAGAVVAEGANRNRSYRLKS